MRKTIALFVVFICTLAFSVEVFAAQNNEDDPGSSITVSDDTTSLTFNFSPSVCGYYATEGTGTNEQWFAISTYHGDGKMFYATSAQQTVVWKQGRDTNETFSNVTIPADKSASESETQWTDSGWAK